VLAYWFACTVIAIDTMLVLGLLYTFACNKMKNVEKASGGASRTQMCAHLSPRVVNSACLSKTRGKKSKGKSMPFGKLLTGLGSDADLDFWDDS